MEQNETELFCRHFVATNLYDFLGCCHHNGAVTHPRMLLGGDLSSSAGRHREAVFQTGR